MGDCKFTLVSFVRLFSVFKCLLKLLTQEIKIYIGCICLTFLDMNMFGNFKSKMRLKGVIGSNWFSTMSSHPRRVDKGTSVALCLVVKTFENSTAGRVPSECDQLRYTFDILEYLFKSTAERVPSECSQARYIGDIFLLQA